MKFAPPSLFSAFAVASLDDPDLPDGIHLRVCLSPDLGPPLAPFTIWQTAVDSATVLTGTGPVKLPVDGDPLDTSRIVALAAFDPSSLPLTLVIADPSGGEICRRSASPWQVAAPAVQSARIEGGSAATRCAVSTVQADRFDAVMGMTPTATLPLPIGGTCVWYAGGAPDQAQARLQGAGRVKRGAPRRLTPVDAPNGSSSTPSPQDELVRVQWKTEIEDKLERLLRADSGEPPVRRVMEQSTPVAKDATEPTIQFGVWDSLLLQTTDIGYARYAGLSTVLDGVPKVSPSNIKGVATGISGFWIAGLFAVHQEDFFHVIDGPLGAKPIVLRKRPMTPDPGEQVLLSRYKSLFNDLDPVLKRAKDAGLVVRPLLTFCAAPSPADPPRAGTVTVTDAKWLAQQKGPSTTLRQGFSITDQPLAATMAMAASTGPGGTFVSRTGVVENSGGRRRPLLAGRSNNGVVTASDTGVPATPLPTYHFHAGDLFGRYGGASVVGGKLPPVPRPPTPVPQTTIMRAVLPAGNSAALSPGTLTVVVPVPDVTALAAGSLAIKAVKWTFGNLGATLPVGGSRVTFDVPLPALDAMASGSWGLGVQFLDTAGTASATATRTVAITDNRAPAAVTAGTGIIWTSRPGPAPDVELNLRWKAKPGHSYRCYLASAASLGLAGSTRAEIAASASSAALSNRSVFQLLNDPPVQPGADGFVTLSATLPRALRDVSFVKVVALSPGGVEGDFAKSGAVPVAVPRDLPPPPPRVFAKVNDVGTAATVTVTATGIDVEALKAQEPGLFAVPPSTDARRPTVRLRRATGPVDDPLYARPVAAPAALVRQADGSFSVEVADPSLVPFVRCTWWAEVRMPDERRLPPGVQSITGDILPGSGTVGDMPGVPSRLSAPFTTLPAPAGPPAALPTTALQAKLTASTGKIVTRVASIQIVGAPVSPPGAVGTWRLRVWMRWGDTPLQLIGDGPTSMTPFSWSSTVMLMASQVTFLATLVDPLGRDGAVASVTVLP